MHPTWGHQAYSEGSGWLPGNVAAFNARRRGAEMLVCEACGSENPDDVHFCVMCQAFLSKPAPAGPTDELPAPDDRPPEVPAPRLEPLEPAGPALTPPTTASAPTALAAPADRAP